ncbi:SHOCT domain-containing protein [Cellulophaga baltica]|uniref:SHOCT domain-containing protein n=1 Tax=Cellulophaga baltica TaxID=76594 RepID=UPI0003F89079|nr:SHOCT domain-containing protein [Cellulophaga baltica]AIY14921.1 hypothetical protein M667_18095 [Cellulophaga baltica NN016038]
MFIKSRKHWNAYTTPILLIIFIALPAIIFYFKNGNPESYKVVKISLLILGVIIFYKSIRKIILNYKVEWIFDGNILIVKSGLLPWKKTHIEMDASQIFEPLNSKNLVGTLLGYGIIKIRRTDGLTTYILEYMMTNSEKIASEISKYIRLNKHQQTSSSNIRVPKESLSDELKKLGDLFKDGVISDEEFEKAKQKIIG